LRGVSCIHTGTGALWNEGISDDPDLEGQGIGEKVAGKIQNKIGHAQKAFGLSIFFHPAE
jgi:hypothetical protein